MTFSKASEKKKKILEKYSKLQGWWYGGVGLAPPLGKGFKGYVWWALVCEKLLTQQRTKNMKNKIEHFKLWSKFNFVLFLGKKNILVLN